MDLTPFHGPPATAPQVPGFAARTLLGFGAHGEVWLAEDLSTGGTVALKVGHRAASAEHETALLCRIDHPHIVRLQRVVALGDGKVALVLDLAAGGSLASLIATRGSFDPGEVTTLLVPLAAALDHLHRRGIAHGDVAPGNVLFTSDGRPKLGDLGVARILGTREGGGWATPGFVDPALGLAGSVPVDSRAVDVWGLAAVGWFALTGRVPEPDGLTNPSVTAKAPALCRLLASCLAANPADRPALDELSDQAWQAARPTPVRLVGERRAIGPEVGLPPLSGRTTRRIPAQATASPTPDRVADRPPENARPAVRRRAVRVALPLGALSLAVAAGAAAAAGAPPFASTSSTSAASTASASTPAVSIDGGLDGELTRALVGIARWRAAAFASVSTRDLSRVDAGGSPAQAADVALVQRLRARGYRLEGVSYQVRGVHVLRRRGEEVDVRAVVTTSGHRRVRATSQVSTPVPKDGPRPVIFTVVPVSRSLSGSDRWRIRSVRAA
jgi:hypothetical protein